MGKVLRAVAVVGLAIGAVATGGALAPGLLGVLGVTATTTALAVASAAIAAAVTIAGTIALNLVLPPPSAKGTATTAIQNYRQSIASSTIIYGKRRVGGLIVFFHPKKIGKTHYRYFVIAVAGHRCKGRLRWFLNDEAVTVQAESAGGKVLSGAYANNGWLWFERGEADAQPNSTFVAECDGRWTSAHKGNGIAKIFAKFAMTDDVVQAGMPTITVEVEGKDDIYDPRDGTTGYSRNAQLIFRDWMATPREEGGFGARADELDDDWDAAYANVCDEDCTTPDGTEPRYAFDSVIATGAAPSEVRTTFITSCAGSYTYSGGKFLMRPGCWEPVSAVLEEDDLAGALSVTPFLRNDEAVNEVNGTYVSPADGYQPQPVQTRRVVAADVRQADADLAHVTSPWQGQRVLEIILRRAQCEKKVTWPMNIMGLGITALDTVRPNTTRYGLSNYAFQVTSWGMDQNFGCVLGLREENEDIYDEPAYIIPGTAGTIAQAEPVLSAAEEAALQGVILNSYTTGLAGNVSAAVDGSTATLTIPTHDRVYADKTVSVTGATLAGLAQGATVLVFYDDTDRSGGAVAYQATTVKADAYVSADHPDRHFVTYWTLPTTASGGSGSGGGSGPPGSGGWTGTGDYQIP